MFSNVSGKDKRLNYRRSKRFFDTWTKNLLSTKKEGLYKGFYTRGMTEIFISTGGRSRFNHDISLTMLGHTAFHVTQNGFITLENRLSGDFTSTC